MVLWVDLGVRLAVNSGYLDLANGFGWSESVLMHITKTLDDFWGSFHVFFTKVCLILKVFGFALGQSRAKYYVRQVFGDHSNFGVPRKQTW